MGNNNSSSGTTSTRRPPRVPFREWEDVSGAGSGSNHHMATTSRNVCYRTLTSNSDSGGIQFENASALDLEEALQEEEGEEDELAELRYDEEESEENPNSTAVSVTAKSVKSPEYTSNDSKACKLKLYNSSDVTLEGNPIGEGKFGKVFRATIRPGKHQTIPFSLAVKEFKCPFDSRNTTRQLGAIMRLKHRNVVTVLGILEDSNYQSDSVRVEKGSVCPRVLLQYFPEGNLLQYLSNRHNPQDYPTMVKLALDIIQGCDYLHSKNVIHGNLAGRNILVEKQKGKGNFLTHYNAKVSDHIEQLFKAEESGVDYMKVPNGTLLPIRSIRWVPHELVDEDNSSFSFPSDVWSFGVVLWEILTKGSVPYGRKADIKRVLELIRGGQSPLSIRRPEGFPEEIIDVLKRIFIVNATKRPSFSELKKEFGSLSTSARLLDMANKYKNDRGVNIPRSPTMKKYASDPHESRSKLKAEAPRGRKPRGHRGFGDSSTSSTREPTAESCSVPKSEEQNNEVKFPKEKGIQPQPPSLRESMITPHQNPRTPMPPRGLGRGNALARPGVYPHSRHHAPPYSNSVAPTLSTMAPHSNVGLFTVPMNSSILPPPPPPYTPSPLPRHFAVGGSRAGVGSRYEKPRDRMFHRADDRRDTNPSSKVSIEEEIKKKQDELERLKMQKLQVEASTITNRLQNVMSEMAELKVGGASPSPQFSAEEANRPYERSHGTQPRSSHQPPDHKGRGRSSSSRGRIRDFSKMAPVTRNYP